MTPGTAGPPAPRGPAPAARQYGPAGPAATARRPRQERPTPEENNAIQTRDPRRAAARGVPRHLATTLVNGALPALVRGLHATTTQLQCVVDSCSLVFAALLLTFGNLSDRFGRKGMLLAGLAVSPPARRSSSRPSPLITMFSMTLRPLRATAK